MHVVKDLPRSVEGFREEIMRIIGTKEQIEQINMLRGLLIDMDWYKKEAELEIQIFSTFPNKLNVDHSVVAGNLTGQMNSLQELKNKIRRVWRRD